MPNLGTLNVSFTSMMREVVKGQVWMISESNFIIGTDNKEPSLSQFALVLRDSPRENNLPFLDLYDYLVDSAYAIMDKLAENPLSKVLITYNTYYWPKDALPLVVVAQSFLEGKNTSLKDILDSSDPSTQIIIKRNPLFLPLIKLEAEVLGKPSVQAPSTQSNPSTLKNRNIFDFVEVHSKQW